MSENTLNNNTYIEEDEIDLRELFKTIVAGKKIIITLVLVVVTLTLFYALKLPNVYKSEAVLIPTAQEGRSALAGLGGLAAMAGVSVGGGSMTPDVAFDSLLGNYDFMKKFVEKNKIYEYYSNPDFDKNYVFALGFRGFYDMFKSTKDEEETQEIDKEAAIFGLIQSIKAKFSISADKKSGLITVSYNDSDRVYAPQMIKYFLRDASDYLVENNLKNIDTKLGYFQQQLNRVDSFELRTSVSAIISKILQEKVMMQSKQYYQCDVLTEPTESYVKAKVKPKRALILVVSFVSSIILGIFVVFFLNFIRSEKETK